MTMTFATQALKDACMGHQGTMSKLTTIRVTDNYGTPGPANLNGKHAHITSHVGIAWHCLPNGDIHILALGQKHNRNTGRGDSGYDWDANGNVNF